MPGFADRLRNTRNRERREKGRALGLCAFEMIIECAFG